MIICYTKQHVGSSFARNCSVALSKGDFFVVLDADDILVRDAIESFLECHFSCGANAVVGDWTNFSNTSSSDYMRA